MQAPEPENNCNGQLPRGLINRGVTQRLPSLRSDASSSRALMANTAATTRGGVLKRTFKPVIHNNAKRNASEEVNHNTSKYEERNHTKDHSNHNRRGRPPKNKHKTNDKQWIQTEGAVFKGESNPQLRSNREREEMSSRKRHSTSIEVGVKREKEDKRSSKIKKECDEDFDDFVGDNFVVDDHPGADLLYPKGWHSVTRHRKSPAIESKPSLVQPLNPYNLFENETDSPEKLLLFQIPEEVVKRSEGKIGKIRVFKSGRIEFHDSQTNIRFDILFDRTSDCQSNVKSEDVKPNLCAKPNEKSSDITEDLVSFNGTDLCAIASLKHKQVLMAVPSIPLDSEAIAKIL